MTVSLRGGFVLHQLIRALGNRAVMTLVNDKPLFKSLGSKCSEDKNKINSLLAKTTVAVGGTFVEGPFFATPDQQEMTVHALYVSTSISLRHHTLGESKLGQSLKLGHHFTLEYSKGLGLLITLSD